MRMSAVIRYSALLVAISAAACSAQLPLPTALPSFLNLVPELRNRVPKANVLSALDGAPFSATLQGFVLSGLLEDYGKLPAIVVQPTETSEVAAVVKFARTHHLPLAVKDGGGRSFRAIYLLADGGIMIDMSLMKKVTVSASKKTVVAQGGATGVDLNNATAQYKLAVPWSTTPFFGFDSALTGGLGYLTRAYGLTVDNILAATVVVADGSTVRATASENPALFGAIRGAGTVFGVVVDLTFRLHDVSKFLGGQMVIVDDLQGTKFKAAHAFIKQALAEEPSLGFEVYQQLASPTSGGTIVIVGSPDITKARCVTLLAPLQVMTPTVPALDTLCQLNYFETEAIVPTNTAVQYGSSTERAAYSVGATVTFKQVNSQLLDLLPKLIYDLPPGVNATFIGDYLGNSIKPHNAVVNTKSYTPFGGDVDLYFFIFYNWGDISVYRSDYAAFAEGAIKQLAPLVKSVQPFVDTTTVGTAEYLDVNVGGAKHLATLRKLKAQYDPGNLFNRNPFPGLVSQCTDDS